MKQWHVITLLHAGNKCIITSYSTTK